MSFYAPPCSLVEYATQVLFAVADGGGEEEVEGNPEEEVKDEEEGDVNVDAQPVVEGGEHYA